jgi:cytochrome P450
MLIAPPPEVEEVRSRQWRENPYPFFERWRERKPVLRLDWPRRGAGDWLVTRHEDVSAALTDPRLKIDRNAADPAPDSPPAESPNAPLQHTVMTTDGPAYLGMRAAMSPVVAGVDPRVEALVRRHAARIARRACRMPRFDLAGDLAGPLCEAVWAEMMRLDARTVARLSGWTETYLRHGFIFGREPVMPSAAAAVERIRSALSASLDSRLAGDEVGFLTDLAAGCGGGHQTISFQNTGLLLSAAMLQSTRHAIVNTVASLIARPEAWQVLRSAPDLIPQALDECLRFDGPSLAVGRIAATELSIANEILPAGAFVRLAIASANRDCERLPSADSLDIFRPRRPHLAFGRRWHACSGAALARTIIGRTLYEALDLMPGPVLDGSRVVQDLESSLRGYLAVPVITSTRC